MRRYLTETVGTFFLVLTIGLTAVNGTPLAPLAIGAVLMVMVYMGGHVSGAHYNPAVTLALVARGGLPVRELVPYWIAQLAGALAAAALVRGLLGATFAPAPAPGSGALAALSLEALFTFALVLVILNVATARATTGNSFYGLAIGFTVMAGALAAGPVSGGAFNPAVGIGPTLVRAAAGEGGFGDLWLYLVGPFAGGLAATALFRVQEQAPAS